VTTVTATAADDNITVSKFISVLSHSCIELARLSNAATKGLYRQLLHQDRWEWRAQRGHPVAAPAEHRATEVGAAAS
jgi:hypothetical protein